MINKVEKLRLLTEKDRRTRERKMFYAKPYPWQEKFYHAGKDNKQRLLMAANRVGKTYSSCLELAYHLTGEYPDWWVGVRFSFPINAWASGKTVYAGYQSCN